MRRFAPANTHKVLLPDSATVDENLSESIKVEDAELRASTGPVESDKDKSRRNQKKLYKSRGSLVEQVGTTDTPMSPKQTMVKRPGKRPHAILPKQVSPHVYIPSVVSVGALAQLLNVKLGLYIDVPQRYDINLRRALTTKNESGRNGCRGHL